MKLTVFTTQVLWQMVLGNMKLSVVQMAAEAEKAASGPDDNGPCLHWLLDRKLYSLTEPCVNCSKSWGTLLMDNINENVSSFTVAYPCCLESGNYLVHGGYNKCPHCKMSKASHLHAFISHIVAHLSQLRTPVKRSCSSRPGVFQP